MCRLDQEVGIIQDTMTRWIIGKYAVFGINVGFVSIHPRIEGPLWTVSREGSVAEKERPNEVDSSEFLPLRGVRVGLLGWEFKTPLHEDYGDDDRRDLNQEGPKAIKDQSVFLTPKRPVTKARTISTLTSPSTTPQETPHNSSPSSARHLHSSIDSPLPSAAPDP